EDLRGDQLTFCYGSAVSAECGTQDFPHKLLLLMSVALLTELSHLRQTTVSIIRKDHSGQFGRITCLTGPLARE
ncbi:hypothetical protein OS493_004285, partial [Desmophyllum pertusum]